MRRKEILRLLSMTTSSSLSFTVGGVFGSVIVAMTGSGVWGESVSEAPSELYGEAGMT